MATQGHLPWRYDHWEKEPSKLKAHDTHVLLSIYEDSSEVRVDKEAIRDDNIPKMCERTVLQPPDTKWSLHLLVTHEDDPREYDVPVPYSLDAVKALYSYWNIPYNYVPRCTSLDTMSMSFSPVILNSAWKGITLDFQYIMSVLTYDTANKRAFGVCLSRRARALERVMQRLEQLPSFASHPLFAPVIMAALVIHDIRVETTDSFSHCTKVQDELGYWSTESEESANEVLDLTRIPQSLNKLAVYIANLEYESFCMVQALSCLREQLKTWPNELCPGVSIELQEQVKFLEQCTTISLATCKSGKENAQSMVQTMYAMLQQRDNQLNHRYGADMRLITAITLIFLPGTFVATFFSTTFWDFSPDNKGTKVTYWVYLYFIVTIGLTLLVLVVWRKFSVLKRLAANMVQVMHQIPLLGKLMKKKRVDDEELGKKGD
ncbi:hypothetical protein CC77DRAFT_438312 [Alternaria alternata]|uniref:Cora-domain-containing protein n=2 Tax=Alternaria alternata TaxID=5599 RepID=A0A177D7S3_ALTAL|nr:hypothetical protein CC77DRAFT_438312 [Alternaria alternata]OAG15793.1 hypothetical protein CC77DRAFT_438312 [Alternaria alternata]RII13017.1 hypothetical protein CUC08_Gglean005136 [Alternaria sp. MG1]RYO65460.1 hypothetical protein AA0116_g2360 [Alternaria tenuissima]